jgi:hypothetical protein
MFVSVWSLHIGYCQTGETYMARLGLQAAAAWKSVNRKPLLASLSRFGVLISPPKQAKSLKPRSSATMTRKLGLLDLLVVSMLLSSLWLCVTSASKMKRRDRTARLAQSEREVASIVIPMMFLLKFLQHCICKVYSGEECSPQRAPLG